MLSLKLMKNQNEKETEFVKRKVCSSDCVWNLMKKGVVKSRYGSAVLCGDFLVRLMGFFPLDKREENKI